MEIDAEFRRQIVSSVSAALVFLVGLVYIGLTYGTSTGLMEEGALALVALIAGFVLLMALVGAYLIRANDGE